MERLNMTRSLLMLNARTMARLSTFERYSYALRIFELFSFKM